MKKNIKAFALVAVLSLPMSMTPSQPNNASGIPVIDFAAIAQMISEGAAEAARWAQQLQTYMNMMKNSVMLSGNQMTADMNRSMMEISKMSQIEVDLANQRRIEDLSPNSEAACLANTASLTMRTAPQKMSDYIASSTSSSLATKIPVAGKVSESVGGGVVQSPNDYRYEVYEEIEAVDSEASNSGEKSLYLRADVFNKDVYSEKELRAMEVQLKLLEGPPQSSWDSTDTNSQAYKREFVQRARKEALRMHAVNSLRTMIALRKQGSGQDGESMMQSLQYMVDETIGSEKWIKRITNTNQDVDKLIGTDEVIREIAMLDAYQTQLMLLQYKQMGRIETLMSIQTLLESNN